MSIVLGMRCRAPQARDRGSYSLYLDSQLNSHLNLQRFELCRRNSEDQNLMKFEA